MILFPKGGCAWILTVMKAPVAVMALLTFLVFRETATVVFCRSIDRWNYYLGMNYWSPCVWCWFFEYTECLQCMNNVLFWICLGSKRGLDDQACFKGFGSWRRRWTAHSMWWNVIMFIIHIMSVFIWPPCLMLISHFRIPYSDMPTCDLARGWILKRS